MAFFTNVFTVDTWIEAKARDFTVTGFPRPTVTRGGYFASTFERVKVGDLLVCYVKAPAMRWVGVLRVESAVFFDEHDAIWGVDEDGLARFPSRFSVAPVVVREIECGVPVQDTIGMLSRIDERNWSGLFRRSLTPLSDEDGQRLLDLLQVEREPQPIRVPRKRIRRAPLPFIEKESDGDAEDTGAPADTAAAARPHLEMVVKLVELGTTLGCDVWVASDERGKSLGGFTIADHVLGDFPAVGLDPESKDLVRTIDVLWIRGRGITAAFEVEATTSVYSGLLRMSDLVALQPNTSIDLYIVAPDERAKKVREQIVRPTFEAFEPPLRKKCRYLSESSLSRILEADPRLLKNLAPAVVKEYAEEVSAS